MGSRENVKADSRVQFSLRLPADLHARLLERAGLVPLNSFIIQSLEASLSVQELIRLADEVVKESVEARTEMASQIGEMSQVVRRMSELMSESVEHSRAVSEELIRMDKARASTESVLRSFVEESQKHLPKDTFASITQAVRAANTETNDTKKKA